MSSVLRPGEPFDYRVTLGGRAAFEANAAARPAPGQSHRFRALGDCASGSPAQKEVAYQFPRALVRGHPRRHRLPAA